MKLQSRLVALLGLTGLFLFVWEHASADSPQDASSVKIPIPAKTRAVTLRLSEEAAYLVLPGMYVNVIESTRVDKHNIFAQTILDKVLVLAVERNKDHKGVSVTLAVPEADADGFKKALDKEKTHWTLHRSISHEAPPPLPRPVIANGLRAVALRVADPRRPLAALVGAQVDILATTRSADGRTEGRVLVQKVRVLAAEASLNARRLGDDYIVTLEVTGEGARQLAAAIVEANTVFHVVIRTSEKGNRRTSPERQRRV